MSSDPQPRPLPSPLAVTVLFFIIMGLQLPCALIIASGQFTIGIVAGQIGALLAPTMIMIWRGHYDWHRCLPLARPPVGLLLAVIPLTIALAYGADLGADLTKDWLNAPPLFEEHYAAAIRMDSIGKAALILSLLALLPALAEECFFRGLCQSSLAAALGPTAGWLISAIFFALAHGSPWYFHLYLLLGLYLGYLRLRSGGLWIPMLAHAINNGWTLAVKYS